MWGQLRTQTQGEAAEERQRTRSLEQTNQELQELGRRAGLAVAEMEEKVACADQAAQAAREELVRAPVANPATSRLYVAQIFALHVLLHWRALSLE